MFLSILIFLASVFISQCHASVTSMSRGVYQPNRTIIFDQLTFRNPRLLYGFCDSSNKCRLEHDREPFERPTDNCLITLKDDCTIDKFRVVPFGRDKAILIWMENIEAKTYYSLASVRFNDCSTHIIRSSFDYNPDLDFMFQPIIASYEDFYEVLFVNSNICGNKYCKMTVAFETNDVRGPKIWTPVDRESIITDVLPLASEDDGLLAIRFSGEISLIKGNDKKVLKRGRFQSSNTTSSTMNYSTTNNYIGICESSNTKLTCSQYKHSGTRIFESTFSVDEKTNSKSIYNLPDRGMLILLAKRSTNIRRILKLDANGIQAGVLDLRIRCSNPQVPAAQFFEKNDKYCVSLACFDADYHNKNRLEVAARCFSLNDIKAAWS